MHLPSSAQGAINERFVAGNPLTGQRATIWTAELCNAVVQEPTNVILAAGLKLDPADNTQLLQAIQIMIDNTIAAALQNLNIGSSGTVGCGSIRDILAQYATVQNGLIVITCPDDSGGGGTDPQPPATGSYALYKTSNSTLEINVLGSAGFEVGAVTLVDDPAESYSIDTTILTITGA